MTVELWLLFGCILVLALSILIQTIHLDIYAGVKYTFGNRDSEPIKLNSLGKRLSRNVANQMEGLAMFVPLIVIVEVADFHSAWTVTGASVYFVCRVLYMICFIFGVTIFRSIIWILGMGGLGAVSFGVVMAAL